MTINGHTGIDGLVKLFVVLILQLAWWIIQSPVHLAAWSLLGIGGLARSRGRHGIAPSEVAQTTTFQPFKVIARTSGTLSAVVAFLAYWTILLLTAIYLGSWLRLLEAATIIGLVVLVVTRRRALLRGTPRRLLALRGMILHPGAFVRWRRHAAELRFDPGILLDHYPIPVGERYVTSRLSDIGDVDLEDLAAREHARHVRARRSPTNANVQAFDMVRLDPLKNVIAAPTIHELLDDEPSTFAPIAWGVDEDGDTVTVDLAGEFHAHGIALASSRGGKTRWAWGVCAQHVARGGYLVVLDGKDGLSFAAFEKLARCRVVGADQDGDAGDSPDVPILERGVAALRWAYEEQRRRNRILRELSAEHGETFDTIRGALRAGVWPEDEARPEVVLVVVDEAPWWTLSPDPKGQALSKQIRGMLDTIASKGASAGIGLLLLTQRATISDDTLPPRARDNVKGIRVLFGTPPSPASGVSVFGNDQIAAEAAPLTDAAPGRAVCTLAGEPAPIAARSWLHDSAWLAAALRVAADRYGLRPVAAEGPQGGPADPGPPKGGPQPDTQEGPVAGPSSAETGAAEPAPRRRRHLSGAAKRRLRREREAATEAKRIGDHDSNAKEHRR